MPSKSPSLLCEIDRVCDAFEQAWQSGSRPQIGEFLAGWEGTQREQLFAYLLSLDLDYAGQTGRETSVDEYKSTYPEFSQVIARHCLRATGKRPRQAASRVVASVANGAQLTFARYKIRGVLGEGAMGAVYLAHDTKLDRDVALKVPRLAVGSGPSAWHRFDREARAAAALYHRNICPVFDAGEYEGTRYITMAYVEGEPLSKIIESDRPRPLRWVVDILGKLAAAMAEAHARGVIHRDLKPANIIIDRDQEPVITDFGLASLRSDAACSWADQPDAILGTPAYMSPEQARGKQDQIGPRTDIYALGVLLYQLLTGRLPFVGDATQVLIETATSAPPRPSEVRAGVDPRLEEICLRMMAKEPSDRYPSMEAVVDDLVRYRSEQSVNAIDARPSRRRGRRLLRWLVAALAIVVAIFMAWRFRTPNSAPSKESTSPPGQSSVASSVWDLSQGGSGHRYDLVVVPDGVTWQEAEAAARKREGHLAVITSAAENRFVFEHLLSDPQAWDLPYGPWIGGFQPDGSSEPAGGWNWVTGEPFEYNNWFPERPLQEPNNGVNSSIVAQELRRRGLPESAREMLTRELQQQGPNTENCLQFIAKDGYGPRDGTWNDRPAESRHQAYIIEFTDPDAN